LLVKIHGLVFTGWILLFLTQTSLVAARRVDLHRRLGVAGAVMAGLLVVLGVTTAIASARRNVAAGNAGALVFLATPLGDMLVFGVLVAAAFYYRRRSDIHKRLMFLATISILGAAFVRWPFAIVANGPLAFFGTTDLFIVAALIHDGLSRGRPHPADVWGGLLIVASQPLRLAVAGTSAWLAIARGIVG
jgi:hypothetical protein